MNPLEKYAALRALYQGVAAALLTSSDEVRAFRKLFRIRGPQDTNWGTLSTRGGEPAVAYDDAKLLAWARQHEPMLVIAERTVTVPAEVHPSLKRRLAKRLQIDGDQVIDSETGEVVDFARVEQTEAIVILKMSDDHKADAAAMVAQHVPQLAELTYRGEVAAS